ncbi:MAG: class I SAM-dependent methyltransferase [Pseudomonadota bacterium]|nr:MAG: SAM-dependent methyltransferase [Pseudomonadota bacterium]
MATRKTSPKRRTRRPALTAATADKHALYERSVQDPEAEIDFIDRVFRAARGRAPVSLCEDFCGTALLAATWVKRSPERTAIGIDIDKSVLAWGTEHNLAPIGEPGRRVQLFRRDVREPMPGRGVDVLVALNFSYWIFQTRAEMRGYFERARRALGRDGVFVLDAYGGWESQEPMLEERAVRGGFTYVWDQDSFDPITHRAVNHIHFRFKDGTKLERAFTYEWRFWTLPEIRELLEEAGFGDVRVYWDTSPDDKHELYRVRRRAENQPGWLAYIVAVR